jgi:general secretion pathway protein G
MNKNKGFTFIEILVVATIIGVLATIGATSYQTASKKSRDGKRKADLEQIRAALELYRADYGQYPTTSSLNSLTTTYITVLPSPPPKSTCSSSSITTYNTSCIYNRTAATRYTITIDLESGGTYVQYNP